MDTRPLALVNNSYHSSKYLIAILMTISRISCGRNCSFFSRDGWKPYLSDFGMVQFGTMKRESELGYNCAVKYVGLAISHKFESRQIKNPKNV